MTRLLVAAAVWLAVAGLIDAVPATVIHVPEQYPTIQAGINAAVEGDTVLVADGTYTGEGNRFLNFHGKAIVAMSENGPECTVIDCGWSAPGFYFHSGEDPNSVVYGFTITHAYHDGGGILCVNNSSPRIIGNTIIENEGASGGGIRCIGSSPVIVGNRIVGNLASAGGGGISCAFSSPWIADNTIADNSSVSFGGGIECWDNSHPHIVGNRIEGNYSWYGGGICCYPASNPTIERNMIVSNSANYGGAIGVYGESFPVILGNTMLTNTATEYGGAIDIASGSGPEIVANRIEANHAPDGGGICCWYTSPTIHGNRLILNTASGEGGGVYGYYWGHPTIEGNLILWNVAGGSGGGIYTEYWCSPDIVNCTISRNEAGGRGGGICVGSLSTTTVQNSIIWRNRAVGYGPEMFNGHYLSVDFSCVRGGWGGIGNIMDYPEFVVGAGLDHRLLWGSPCIDAGDPWMYDPDGTRSDMGAYYFNQDDSLTLYLTASTDEALPGTQVGVLYTLINRWQEPAVFWGATGLLTPEGDSILIMRPRELTLPGNYTARIPVVHTVPPDAPAGTYEYAGAIGIPPATLFDADYFSLAVLASQGNGEIVRGGPRERLSPARALAEGVRGLHDPATHEMDRSAMTDAVVREARREKR